MDVIGYGDFAITNLDGRTWMSFRTPSSVHIDYVHDEPLLDSKRSRSYEVMEHVDSILTVAMNHVLVNTTPGDCGRPRVVSG